MTKHRGKAFRLDVDLEMRKSLFESGPLDRLQEVLRQRAPRWSSNLRIWRDREKKTPIDVAQPGALAEAVKARVLEDNPSCHKRGSASADWRTLELQGMVEMRGAVDSIILILSLNTRPFSSICDRWGMDNGITLQICRARVEGIPSAVWAVETFEALCRLIEPDIGNVCFLEEEEAKNISREGGGFQAIGGDISRYLPGVYWANFYGEVYCDFIGRDKLLSAPAHEVREVAKGILAIMSERPQDWDTPEYKERVGQFLDHVGREYFFERDNPDKPTHSPFHLPNTWHRKSFVREQENLLVVAALRASGIQVESIYDLPHLPQQRRAAVPVLLKMLPRVKDEFVKTAIVHALKVLKAKEIAARPLIEEFRNAEASAASLKWAIAATLAEIASDGVFEEIMELLKDRGHGRARQMLAYGLGNMRNARAVALAMEMLDDDEVAGHAIYALGKLKAKAARGKIERFLEHPKRWVRNEAKNALHKIDKGK